MSRIETVEQLRQHYGQPSRRALFKDLDYLDGYCRRFIELSPFLILASNSATGTDASPRGDGPGFVQVPDAHTLLLPDWPGNNRLDSFSNIVQNPHIGLLFLIPGVDETLRVNGRAEIRTDEVLRERFETKGKLPITVLKVKVHQAFLQCAKALMRSGLWTEKARVARDALPTMGEMLSDQTGSSETKTQAEVVERYREGLH